MNLERLVTENRNENTLDIDKLSTFEIIKLMNNEDKKVANVVELQLSNIVKAIDEIVLQLKSGGRLIYVGAGTSGRLGILDASECPPTFGVSDQLVQAVIAGGYEAIFKAKEGAEDSKQLAIDDLKLKNLNEKDIVVGIAASGRTPYVISAIEYANEIGIPTISISCNENSKISKVSKIAIELVVGAEVITGSTRLKAGTAQKLVLNMISTGVMIKLGKVYSNLMVDVKANNEKLVERAKMIVCEATGVDKIFAEGILNKTDYDVKLSIFIILSGLDLEKAKEILKLNGGYIAEALKFIK